MAMSKKPKAKAKPDQYKPPSEAYYKKLAKLNYARDRGLSDPTLTLNSTTNTVKRQLLEREYAKEQAKAKAKAKPKPKKK